MTVSVVGTTSANGGVNSQTSVSTAIHASAAVGDLALIVAANERGAIAPTVTCPTAGYTSGYAISSSNAAVEMGWKRLTAGDLSGNVTASFSTARRGAIAVIVLRGAGDPTFNNGALTSSSTTHTAPAATPTTADSLLVALSGFGVVNSPFTRTFTPSAGWTETADTCTSNAGTNAAVTVDYEQITGGAGASQTGVTLTPSDTSSAIVSYRSTVVVPIALSTVTQTSAAAWSVASTVTASTAAAWAVRALVTAATSTVGWATRGAATASTSVAWPVRQSAAMASAVAWSVRQQVSATRSPAWAVRQQVTPSNAVAWTVRQSVAKTSSSSWNDRAAVGKTAATSWDVLVGLTPIEKTEAAAWAVRARVNPTVSAFWNVSNTFPVAATTRSVAWATRQRLIRVGPAIAWATRQRALTGTSTLWGVRVASTATKPVTWSTAGRVAVGRLIAWRVGQGVGPSTVEVRWRVRRSTANDRDITVTARLLPSPWSAVLLDSTWSARMGDVMIVGSQEFAHVEVGSDHDISGRVVEVSFDHAVTWWPADHVSSSGSGSSWTSQLRVLIGPAGDVDPVDSATALVRVTDDPEIPILPAGMLYRTLP